MTKNERKAMQDFINRIEDYQTQRNNAFAELQKLSVEAGLPKYCSAKENRDQLVKVGNRYADNIYNEYVKMTGKIETMHEFGEMLASLSFWKNN